MRVARDRARGDRRRRWSRARCAAGRRRRPSSRTRPARATRTASARRAVRAPARELSRRPTPTRGAAPRSRGRPRRAEPGRAPRSPRDRRRARRRRAGAQRDRPRGRALRAGRARLVAVTGTNGKTTVTTLIAAMLRGVGRRAASPPATSAGRCSTPSTTTSTCVVAEVSSFQLAFTTDAFAPDVAVLLNVAEDHLDWHGSVDALRRGQGARLRAPERRTTCSSSNRDDPVALRARRDARAAGSCGSRVGAPAPGGYGVVRRRRSSDRDGRRSRAVADVARVAARPRQRARRRRGRARGRARRRRGARGRSRGFDGPAPPRAAGRRG